MSARTHRWPFVPVFPAAFVVFALLLPQFGCKPTSPGDATGPKTELIQLIPITNMVAIKAGTFMRIKFPVTITRDFWIGKQ